MYIFYMVTFIALLIGALVTIAGIHEAPYVPAQPLIRDMKAE